MAKQVIISAIEEVLGEYILNIDKENLKIEALRGNIKLENVQLDGDLLGSHVLGVVGLHGFAILSCWAKSLKIKIPYHNLENEPTRFEMKGVHLLCLPLLPSTAGRIFGEGTKNDPRCTLRTRAKRSKLMTFENNFMAGRIVGEGPPSKRVLRAVRDVERALSKRKSRKINRPSGNEKDKDIGKSTDESMVEDTILLESLAADLMDTPAGDTEDNELNDDDLPGSGQATEEGIDASFAEIPRDWKVRLKEKIFRNLVASMESVHIRCELSQGGLDFRHHESDKSFATDNRHASRNPPDQRAFALGFTLEKFLMQTADENWNVGSHEKHSKTTESSDHLGPNPYDERNNKLISFQNFCMYWDDNPPFLISETKALTSPDTGIAGEKLQLRIGTAMGALLKNQEPGRKIRDNLDLSSSKQRKSQHIPFPDRDHQYICENMTFQLRHKTSDRLRSGPISCRVEFLHFNFDLKLRPHQYVQYQKLKSAMLSQKRFDTMLRQRPNKPPVESPRSWWKYAIACVTARPNSRPWNDVLKICRCRNRYIDLVAKKSIDKELSEEESKELLAFQDALPIEALQAFHLVALRKVTKELQRNFDEQLYGEEVRDEALAVSEVTAPKNRLSKLFRGSKSRASSEISLPDSEREATVHGESFGDVSLIEIMKERLGKKPWFIDFRWDSVEWNLTLLSAVGRGIVQLQAEGCGNIQTLGVGKRSYFFDVTKFEVVDSRFEDDSDSSTNKIFVLESNSYGEVVESNSTGLSEILGPNEMENHSEHEMDSSDLPPPGIVCRLLASRDVMQSKIHFSAHPATLVWTRPCFDAIAEFFGAPSTEMQTELTLHLRNAATPLARKAQLALFSPASLIINANVAAPKIWIPLQSKGESGSLFLDAGHFRFVLAKEGQRSPMAWKIDARNIQINFAKSLSSPPVQASGEGIRGQPIFDDMHPHLSPVIRPFHVEVSAGGDRSKQESSGFDEDRGTSSVGDSDILVIVSPVCINLVDLDQLARAIGRWYTQGILRMRELSSSSKFKSRRDRRVEEKIIQQSLETIDRSEGKPGRSFSVEIKKLEMALEGHSKATTTDDKSIVSHETSLVDFSPPIRTYVVEIFKINILRRSSEVGHVTNLTVEDVSIVQLEDSSDYIPLKARHDASDLHYTVLGRGKRVPASSGQVNGSTRVLPGVYLNHHALSAKIYHDAMTHVDEVEVDIFAIVVRVTPTSLKDCAKAARKCLELVQVITTQMERKVHERGRKARARGREGIELSNSDMKLEENSQGSSRPNSPAFSLTSDISELQKSEASLKEEASDSSLVFKVTVKESCLLAGRPTIAKGDSSSHRVRSDRKSVSFAVAQVFSNVLIMFQSIENPDTSGVKTLHVSLENLSASVVSDFKSARPPSPMVGPTGVEFRSVNKTEDLGVAISHEISLDCDDLKSCFTPGDFFVLISVLKTMSARLFQKSTSEISTSIRAQKSPLNSIFKYRKKGSGVATSIRLQCHNVSFVLLRPYQSKIGAPQFLSCNINDFKMKLSGCVSAMSGDCSARVSIDCYNDVASSWEYAVEPCDMLLTIDQMPEEILLDLSSSSPLQINVTGLFLSDLAALDLSAFWPQKDGKEALGTNKAKDITPSVLKHVGLRQATESNSVRVFNDTGLDLLIVLEGDGYEPPRDRRVSFESIGPGLVKSGQTTHLELRNKNNNIEYGAPLISDLSLGLSLAPTAVADVGEREQIKGLPVSSLPGSTRSLHILSPKDPARDDLNPHDQVLHFAEPVVEWCFQNQRLRSNVADVFSLDKGRDILSSAVWSPEEAPSIESSDHTVFKHKEDLRRRTEPSEQLAGTSRSCWVRPYLKNDAPEWTDMTCILELTRERVMLPDTNWIWVNDWSVDLSGKIGEQIDSDGWSYEADFETFTRRKRFYQRGDCCRRRRWTRTRIIRPPKLGDPLCPLKIVWESTKNEQGNFSIEIRSNLALHNTTDTPLWVFMFSPSWNEERFGGCLEPGRQLNVPILLASAVYLRLAKPRSSFASKSLEDFFSTDPLMILPHGYNSCSTLRSSMRLNDLTETCIHFLVEVISTQGIVDVHVKPVLKLVNLLPCQLECRLGESLRSTTTFHKEGAPLTNSRLPQSHVASLETVEIGSGSEHSCISVNPLSRPHVSFRVPGYHWSSWYKVINRRANSQTWIPVEADEDIFAGSRSKPDCDWADELTTVVSFDRLVPCGDRLKLIFALEHGQVPTLRIYSEYWVLDRTGFGCRFCAGFTDLLGTIPDEESTRRSHLPNEELRNADIIKDFGIPGHEWSIGMCGMTMFYSAREKISMCIETETLDKSISRTNAPNMSKWVSPLDISNVMPKTVFSVDQHGGQRRFELAISVSVCTGIFARTKIITFIPRYQVVNLLKREIVIAQEGCLDASTVVSSQSAVSFHWEKSNLPTKVRLGAPSNEEKSLGEYTRCWTNGSIQLDKIGITSIRFPSPTLLPSKPMVTQAEIRLASKDQHAAVVLVLWSANEHSNPLYLLRNDTKSTILCRQPLHDHTIKNILGTLQLDSCGPGATTERLVPEKNVSFQCGLDMSPSDRSVFGHGSDFIWALKSGDVCCFGFDDPEKLHLLEWTSLGDENYQLARERVETALVEVDAMGTSSAIQVSAGEEILCDIRAEHSTKVIHFSEAKLSKKEGPTTSSNDHCIGSRDEVPCFSAQEIPEEFVVVKCRMSLSSLSISCIDNKRTEVFGREILLAHFINPSFSFSQSHDGYYETELILKAFQIDNHIQSSIHPVLLSCTSIDANEPFIHISAVKRLQEKSNTHVFRYAAIRILEVNLSLDRCTVETIARFIEPFRIGIDSRSPDPLQWLTALTADMKQSLFKFDREAPKELERAMDKANVGRIYFEQLHLHPVRLNLTFTQEWSESSGGTDGLMVFQFIRGMASIADAPLRFNSFVVADVFESPQTLVRVIVAHYSSQLTKQIFGILGSLAIFGAPADFISNVGTGVRDFFYEPINGAVHGPRQFIEGLEAGTQSLARGVFVGVVRGAANVTEIVNSNLVGLTDNSFIDERKAHQRMLTDALSRGVSSRSFKDSLFLAGSSVARGLRSGAFGIVEEPTRYAAKHGPIGFVKGVGTAALGALIKPMVGVGDAATLIMNHVSDATSKKKSLRKIPIRLRRALPVRSTEKPSCVILLPFDDRAAKAQKIVTGGDSVDDIYLGHVNIPSHLIISSQKCLWAIDRRSREPWCVNWEDISHVVPSKGGLYVVIFSQWGLKPYHFPIDKDRECQELIKLLSMQLEKLGNSSNTLVDLHQTSWDVSSKLNSIPGFQSYNTKHTFGSCNKTRRQLPTDIKDEIDLIEQCFCRVKQLGSQSPDYLETLDNECWSLVSCWGQIFSGLSSRRCIAAGLINGTGVPIQIKTTLLTEGGSPCYSIPTSEFDVEQGMLREGGSMIFFGYGVVPSLLQAGDVFMHIETNSFIADLSVSKGPDTSVEATPGFLAGFLEKSYDEAGWWAKYWILVRKATYHSESG